MHQCMAGQSVRLAALVCQAYGYRGLGTLRQPAPLLEPLADFEPSQMVPRRGKTLCGGGFVPSWRVPLCHGDALALGHRHSQAVQGFQ